ncbi:MAG: TonB-dependent receptor, partial [Gammaproteobacteria bacterium]|nr:TonB-dependent receptor [Gammaproteobacteria bacterium]
LFHTEFEDMISTGTPVPNCWAASGPNLPGCLDLGSGFTQDSFAQNTNVGEAESRGAEFAARWDFAPRWSIGGNWTWTDTEQKSGADRGAPFTNQANHIVNASLDWDATDTLSLWLRGEYQGERDRFTSLRDNLSASDRAILDGLGPLKSWTQFHLGGSWRASDRVTFNATIYNLLDKDFLEGGYYPLVDGGSGWGSYYAQIGRSTTGTIQEGRRLWLSVNLEF